jgi:hypothetical protein
VVSTRTRCATLALTIIKSAAADYQAGKRLSRSGYDV